jgi:cobalt-zinc-cadmium efflux system outer membrane protein
MKHYVTIAAFWMTTGMVLSGCAFQQDKTESARYDRMGQYSYQISPYSPKDQNLPELTESAGLSDCLEYAALHNPGLEAAFNRWKAALERVPQVSSLPDPRFSYRYFIQEVETRVGAQRQAFELSQAFPWFGKLDLRGDVALQAANTQRQLYEAAKLKLFFEVKDAYYEYYYLAKAIAVTRENVNLVKHMEGVTRTRFKTAAGTHPDVIRAQVELGKLEDRLRSLLDLRKPLGARLNAALNRPVEAELPWPGEFEIESISLTDQQLLTWMTQDNPELKALDFEINRQKQSIELARKDYYPDISLGVNYIDTAAAIGNMNPHDSGKDPVAAMVSVNLPLWRDKYSAAVREAKHLYYSALHNKTDKTNTLGVQLKLALYHFRDAERKIDLYGNALLPKAGQSLKVTEADFQAGRGSFTDLIDAQRVLLEFQLAYERARADHEQSLAQLEMLIGKKIPFSGSENDPPNIMDNN